VTHPVGNAINFVSGGHLISADTNVLAPDHQACAFSSPFCPNQWGIYHQSQRAFCSGVSTHRELCGIFVRFQVFDKLPDDLIAFILRFS
jgi:hypothetical protein